MHSVLARLHGRGVLKTADGAGQARESGTFALDVFRDWMAVSGTELKLVERWRRLRDERGGRARYTDLCMVWLDDGAAGPARLLQEQMPAGLMTHDAARVARWIEDNRDRRQSDPILALVDDFAGTGANVARRAEQAGEESGIGVRQACRGGPGRLLCAGRLPRSRAGRAGAASRDSRGCRPGALVRAEGVSPGSRDLRVGGGGCVRETGDQRGGVLTGPGAQSRAGAASPRGPASDAPPAPGARAPRRRAAQGWRAESGA